MSLTIKFLNFRVIFWWKNIGWLFLLWPGNNRCIACGLMRDGIRWSFRNWICDTPHVCTRRAPPEYAERFTFIYAQNLTFNVLSLSSQLVGYYWRKLIALILHRVNFMLNNKENQNSTTKKGSKENIYHNISLRTFWTKIIAENYFMEQLRRRSVEHGVHST